MEIVTHRIKPNKIAPHVQKYLLPSPPLPPTPPPQSKTRRGVGGSHLTRWQRAWVGGDPPTKEGVGVVPPPAGLPHQPRRGMMERDPPTPLLGWPLTHLHLFSWPPRSFFLFFFICSFVHFHFFPFYVLCFLFFSFFLFFSTCLAEMVLLYV